MKYNRVSFGTTEAVFNKLGGEKGIKDFLSGRTMVVKSERNFVTLKIITVKAWQVGNLTKNLLNDKLIEKDENAKSVLTWPQIDLSEDLDVELIIVTPRELGFEEMFESCATYSNICKKASEFGLEKVPVETGMLLCLPQNREKSKNFYVVASKLANNKDGHKFLLVPWYQEDGKKMELKAFDAEGRGFCIDFKFLFCRKKVVL